MERVFELLFSPEAEAVLADMEADASHAKKLKKVRKSLGQLQVNPRHPGLQTHKYESLQGPDKQEVFEAYVENNAPAAWRIWFWYGPAKKQLTILAIGPHP